MKRNKKQIHGDKRIINKFLFLPRTIRNETRWLSFEKIEQKYMNNSWQDIAWITRYL